MVEELDGAHVVNGGVSVTLSAKLLVIIEVSLDYRSLALTGSELLRVNNSLPFPTTGTGTVVLYAKSK
jgi:hypothetical protein